VLWGGNIFIVTNATAHRFEALDGLRGVAALTVMCGHFGLLLGLFSSRNGFLAVDTFFIMSGFVIAYSYGERLRHGMSAWTYLYRRMVRLYPMFIVGLLLGCAVLYYGVHNRAIAYQTADILRGAALNVFYIPFLNSLSFYHETGQIFPSNPPAWSLFFEMVASGAFLLLCGLGRRSLTAVVVLCYVALIAAGIHFGHDRTWVEVHNGYYASNFLGGLPRVGLGFSFGVLLQRLARDDIAGSHIRALIGRLPYASFLLYAAVLVIFLFPSTAHGLYPLLALATIVPAVVFIGAHVPLRRGFERNVAKFLGWISYPIYCVHYPIVRLVIFMRDSGYGSAYLLMAGGVVASLVLAIGLTRWFDEPVRGWLSARKGAPSPRTPPPLRAPRAN
jgi:peptidoglycan/LPS O-acetylase OafA/YrhL